VNRPLSATPAVCGLRSTPGEKKATSLQAQVSDGAERSVLKGETHTVSVVRAGQASEQTFVRDAGGLWAPVNTR